MKSRIGTPSFHLIDGRAAVFYDGVEAGGPRKGHIAGAKSLPFTEVDRRQAVPAQAGRAEGAVREGGRRAGRHGRGVLSHRPAGDGGAVRRAARSVIRCCCTTDRSRSGRASNELPVEDPRAGRTERAVSDASRSRQPAPYADPYLAGVALGLVLLASFVIAGRGLGASGAFATAAATTVQRVAPDVGVEQRASSRRTSTRAGCCATGSSSRSSA